MDRNFSFFFYIHVWNPLYLILKLLSTCIQTSLLVRTEKTLKDNRCWKHMFCSPRVGKRSRRYFHITVMIVKEGSYSTLCRLNASLSVCCLPSNCLCCFWGWSPNTTFQWPGHNLHRCRWHTVSENLFHQI
jgi:hypothetical protein